MRRFWIVTVAALFYGCGGKGRPDLVTTMSTGGRVGPATTGGRSSGGNGGSPGSDAGSGAGPDTTPGGAGGDGGEATVDARAPIVAITSPSASSDPDQDEVLLANNVTVLCTVSKSKASGAVAVDTSKIKIAMLDANDKVLKETGGSATGSAGEYSATFAITDQPNGVVHFRCTANDVAVPPRTASTKIGTFIDHGPKITITSPLAISVKPLKTPVAFEFTVEPWPLADGDVGAAVDVDKVSLSVLGEPVTSLAPAPQRPGVYIATVDFSDPVLYPEPPATDVPVLVTAPNKRSPMAALRSEAYGFKLDGDGPVIKITTPKPNDIVGPKTRVLSFTVTDLVSGVDKSKVAVTLNGVEFQYDPAAGWTENKGTYTFTFNGTQIEGSVAQATINVHAADLVGNEADGESLVIYLDDHPPIVSLDPPHVRVAVEAPVGKFTCSSSFDPLGSAVSDGDTIADSATFRVLAWDETNHAVGQRVDYLSGVERTSVFLYLQPDPEQPLLVDLDKDHVCDHVNTQDAAGKDLLFIRLTAVSPTGALPKDPNTLADEPAVSTDFCQLSTAPSPRLCSSDMSYVIKHEIVGMVEPVVYARDPVAGNPLTCTGNSWEVRGLAKHSGWVCMAAVASDSAKNEGHSAPLRVCIDDDDDTTTSPCAGIEPPSCTDGCTLPPNFPSRLIQYKG
jgi:hypothetical protein